MKELWKDTASKPRFESLEGSINTDVLIIGGGAAGILCGYYLKKSGVDYVIAEADEICNGVTAGTTAKISVQHGLVYNKLKNMVGTTRAKLYLEANFKAVDKYRQLCDEIECDFETVDSYIYSVNNRKKLEKEIEALEQLDCKAEFCNTEELPFETAGAVKIANQAQFNPLKFFYTIAKYLNIYENTAVKELKGLTAITDKGEIKAKKIIVATHFPFLNKHGSYFLKMHQNRSYVAAISGAPKFKGIYRDEADKGFSFRSYNDYLIIGAESHRTGEKSCGWSSIEAFKEKYYSSSEIQYRWAAQDCITLDKMPYAGNYSKTTPNLYVTTGFNKWGMTGSMVAAEILSDMIQEKRNDYTGLLTPSRSIIRAQTVENICVSSVNLICPAKKRCPHLGCGLKWNKHEHSWDCPCHGSRFSNEGKLLDNPATGDLKETI